jgi:hypothetical protein
MKSRLSASMVSVTLAITRGLGRPRIASSSSSDEMTSRKAGPGVAAFIFRLLQGSARPELCPAERPDVHKAASTERPVRPWRD